jgi:hypothetical protein
MDLVLNTTGQAEATVYTVLALYSAQLIWPQGPGHSDCVFVKMLVSFNYCISESIVLYLNLSILYFVNLNIHHYKHEHLCSLVPLA